MLIIDNGRLLHEFQNLLSNGYIHILFWMIMIDIFSGTIKGVFFKKEGNSTKGLVGVLKHFLIMMTVVLLYPYLVILNLQQFGTMFVLAYIVMYAISIVENWGQMGLYVPSFIKDKLKKLQNDFDQGKNNKGE